MLETSWTALQADVGKASDLDALVQAHDAYLRRIAETAFLLGPDKARVHAALQAVGGAPRRWLLGWLVGWLVGRASCGGWDLTCLPCTHKLTQ